MCVMCKSAPSLLPLRRPLKCFAALLGLGGLFPSPPGTGDPGLALRDTSQARDAVLVPFPVTKKGEKWDFSSFQGHCSCIL